MNSIVENKFLMAGLTALFFFALFYMSGANLRYLVDMPTAIAVIFGTILIFSLRYRKNMKRSEVKRRLTQSIMISTIIVFFTGVFGILTIAGDFESLVSGFAVSLISILYGMALYLAALAAFRKEDEVAAVSEGNDNVSGNGGTIEEASFELDDLGLTKREMEIVGELVKGKSNRDIAESLFISETTVKKHLANIYAKCDVTSRQALMAKLLTK